MEHQVAAQVNEDAISFLQLANGAMICCTRRKMQSASAA
jgi:hypothetical protein